MREGVSHLVVAKWIVRLALLLMCAGIPVAGLADADDAPASTSGPPPGMHPLTGPIPAATPFAGESRLVARPDGTYNAIPQVAGTTKTFHIVAREAPWTLKPGLAVMAKTYNGVVPGPTLLVNQGDHVVIDYRNELAIPDTIHLHGVHGLDVDMDGVPGSSQALVPPHGTYRYVFTAVQPGTFIYHTHDSKAVLDAGLYGAIVVTPSHPRPEERGIARDYLEIISSWYINSNGESEFTLNGKEYPATQALDVRAGERIRIRWINISAENFHTMHTHGHYMRIIARDAMPISGDDIEDTISLGPGQRVDTTLLADQKPGTWIIHCHVLDHIENAAGMPDGLITALHYVGTPNRLAAMYDAMMRAMPNGAPTTAGAAAPSTKLSFGMTVLLGAFAGLTIFLGLPIARARRLKPGVIALLNAFAIGILVFLVIEISMNAIIPVNQAITAWHRGASFPFALVLALGAGLVLGLVGLGSLSSSIVRRTAQSSAERPLVLAAIIAIGIGAHNFAEGLAIGASAAAGATALAAGLIIGFALHNATEGFGVAAPLAGKVVPSWGQLGLAGLIAGGPTFLGTVVGYNFSSPTLSVFFLATAIGALVFVIGELWAILKKTGVTVMATTMVTAGFAVAFVTEALININGG